MPWEVVKNDEACPLERPYGVHAADGALEGCHTTETEAEAQVANLYAMEADVEDEPAPAEEMLSARSAYPRDNLLRALQMPESAKIQDTPNGMTLFGHFAVFNEWTRIDSAFEGNFMERIAPGAFAQTFSDRGANVRVLYDHGRDPSVGNKPLGVPVALSEDERGAFYEVELFDTAYVNELRPALAAGQLGSSFRFSVVDEMWQRPTMPTAANPAMLEERTITAVELFEFGPVTFPAYEAATAGLRSRTDEFMESLADPNFAVRLADRIGIRAAQHLLESMPEHFRSESARQDGAPNGQPATTTRKPTEQAGRLLASAVTEIARRK